MLPQSQPRKKQQLVEGEFDHFVRLPRDAGALVVFYFAAREGLLGKQLKKLSVEMVKEKPPEKPKEPEKPKIEPPKVETRRKSPRRQNQLKTPKAPRRRSSPRPWSRRQPPKCRRLNLKAARPSQTSSDPVQTLQKLYGICASARNGTARRTWPTTITSPKWR